MNTALIDCLLEPLKLAIVTKFFEIVVILGYKSIVLYLNITNCNWIDFSQLIIIKFTGTEVLHNCSFSVCTEHNSGFTKIISFVLFWYALLLTYETCCASSAHSEHVQVVFLNHYIIAG